MGIPYSKEINQAFDQVAPLVAATLDVLQTSKNITYLLAAVQVINAVLLLIAVISLLGLLITVNPDLAEERRALVTPVVRHLASWVMPGSEGRWYLRVVAWSVATVWLVGCAATAYYGMRENDRKYWDDSAARDNPATIGTDWLCPNSLKNLEKSKLIDRKVCNGIPLSLWRALRN